MKKILFLFLFVQITVYSQTFQYLNASTGNFGEGLMSSDSSHYYIDGRWIRKYDKNLNPIWSYYCTLYEFNGLLLSKTGSLFFYTDFIFGKMDPNGTIIWSNIIGPSTSNDVRFNFQSAYLNSSNHLMLSGTSTVGRSYFLDSDTLGNYNVFELKRNSPLPFAFESFYVKSDSAGNYSFIGVEDRPSGDYVYLIKSVATGSIQSAQTLKFNINEGFSNSFEFENFYKSGYNNRFFITGFYGSKNIIGNWTATAFCFDQPGNLKWGKSITVPFIPTNNILSLCSQSKGETCINLNWTDPLFNCTSDPKNVGLLFLDSLGVSDSLVHRYFNNYCPSNSIYNNLNPYKNKFVVDIRGGFFQYYTFLKYDSINSPSCMSKININISDEGTFASKTLDSIYFSAAPFNSVFNNFNLQLLPTQTSDFCSSVGITKYDKNYEIEIFPNPANENITIKVKQFLGKMFYSLSDPYGRILKEGELREEKENLNIVLLNDLMPGVYFVKVRMGDVLVLKKILKQ